MTSYPAGMIDLRKDVVAVFDEAQDLVRTRLRSVRWRAHSERWKELSDEELLADAASELGRVKAPDRPKRRLKGPQTLTCPTCKTWFTVSSNAQKYCSISCRNAAKVADKRPLTIRCEHCRVDVPARWARKRWCGAACREASVRQQRTGRPARIPVKRSTPARAPDTSVRTAHIPTNDNSTAGVCAWAECRKPFHPRDARQRFCSQQCKWRGCNAKRRVGQLQARPERPCANTWCTITFRPRHGNASYCSEACQREHYDRRMRARRRETRAR